MSEAIDAVRDRLFVQYCAALVESYNLPASRDALQRLAHYHRLLGDLDDVEREEVNRTLPEECDAE